MTRLIAWPGAMLLAIACSSPPTPGDGKAEMVDPEPVFESREGQASFVARALHGDRTASGGTFDGTAMVAAHPTYPFGTRLRVTHLENGRRITVRVVDRGPAREPRAEGVI